MALPVGAMTVSQLEAEAARLEATLAATAASTNALIARFRADLAALEARRVDDAAALAAVDARRRETAATLRHVALPHSCLPWVPELERLAGSTARVTTTGGAEERGPGAPDAAAAALLTGRLAADGTALIDQPDAQVVGGAFIVADAAGRLCPRPATTDVAVGRAAGLGRVLVARRAVEAGALVFTERAVLDVPAVAAAAAPLLPPLLRATLENVLLGEDAAAAMQHQGWDPRLAAAVLLLLGRLTQLATAAGERPARPPLSDVERIFFGDDTSDDDAEAPAAAPEPALALRRAVDYLCAPLGAVPEGPRRHLARFAAFVAAALPPSYRRFATDEQRLGAETAWRRRGGAAAAAPGACKLRDDEEPTAEQAAPDVAPYDADDPLRQQARALPALPRCCRVDEEDVLRVLLALQCNAVARRATPLPAAADALERVARGAEGAGPTGGVSLFVLLSLVEHSEVPNAVVAFRHVPGVDGEGSLPAHISPAASAVELRALRPLAPGERLSISYAQAVLPFVERAKRLEGQYFFAAKTVAPHVLDTARVMWHAGRPVAPRLANGAWVYMDPEGGEAAAADADAGRALLVLEARAEAVASTTDAEAEAAALRTLLTATGDHGTALHAGSYGAHLRLTRLFALAVSAARGGNGAVEPVIAAGAAALGHWGRLLLALGCGAHAVAGAVRKGLAAAAAMGVEAPASDCAPSSDTLGSSQALPPFMAAAAVSHVLPLLQHHAALVTAAAKGNHTAAVAAAWAAIAEALGVMGLGCTAAAAKAAVLSADPSVFAAAAEDVVLQLPVHLAAV